MKKGPDALDTSENESMIAKHDNGTRRSRYRRKRARERKTCKRDLTPSVPPKMSPGAQNMKSGPDALTTTETSPGAQNMKMGPDALDTSENESVSAKH
jgi:hypothetical protein